MIGHGVRAALKRQDWVAIAIEFVLVVIGVLLAFQISEWATLQDRRQLRRDAVERLLREAQYDVAVLIQVEQLMNQNVANLSVAAAHLRDPAPPPALAKTMTKGITSSFVMPKPATPDSVYNQLIASGLFSELGDDRMRDAVSAYASTRTYLDQGIDYARSRVDRTWPGDAIHHRYDPTAERYQATEIDFRKLSADRDLQDAIFARLSGLVFVEQNYKNTLDAAWAMCRELARVAGKPCQPPAAPENS